MTILEAPSSIGQLIKFERVIRNLNRREIASRCGISTQALWSIEAEKADPRWSTVARIAQALEVPLSHFAETMQTQTFAAVSSEAVDSLAHATLAGAAVQQIAHATESLAQRIGAQLVEANEKLAQAFGAQMAMAFDRLAESIGALNSRGVPDAEQDIVDITKADEGSYELKDEPTPDQD